MRAADDGIVNVSVPAWRAYCDELHRRLASRWLGRRHYRRALKTDLFDEAVSDGLATYLLSRAAEVYGIDVAEHVVARACARHPSVRGAVGDVRDTKAPDSYFDLIVSNSTLDHFPERASLLLAVHELARVLEPGGDMLISLDNPWNPVVALRNRLPSAWFGRSSALPYFVGHTLSRFQLCAALTGAGLHVVRAEYFMHVPRLLCLHLCRLLPVGGGATRMMIRALFEFERLRELPTAPVTGHYIAVHARKPDGPPINSVCGGQIPSVSEQSDACAVAQPPHCSCSDALNPLDLSISGP